MMRVNWLRRPSLPLHKTHMELHVRLPGSSMKTRPARAPLRILASGLVHFRPAGLPFTWSVGCRLVRRGVARTTAGAGGTYAGPLRSSRPAESWGCEPAGLPSYRLRRHVRSGHPAGQRKLSAGTPRSPSLVHSFPFSFIHGEAPEDRQGGLSGFAAAHPPRISSAPGRPSARTERFHVAFLVFEARCSKGVFGK